MRTTIELYINDLIVDLSDESFILMNYTEEDADQPTAVMNSFSKQIQLPATDENRKIFEFMDVPERATLEQSFNPLHRSPFMLVRNGELLESGYCRLDEADPDTGFKVTLFGGLGSFMYALTYNDGQPQTEDSGNAKDAPVRTKTLGDITYRSDTINESEFNFTITKGAVSGAWSALRQSFDSMWKYINFAPMYNGLPKTSFAADKALVAVGTAGLPGSADFRDKKSPYYGRSSYGGYALINLIREFDEWEMRDLRSYLQRPVLSVAGFIKAISRQTNNGGWTVDTDALAELPEVKNGWLTLPMLSVGNETLPSELEFSFNNQTSTGTSSAIIRPSGSFSSGTKFNVSVEATPRIFGVSNEPSGNAGLILRAPMDIFGGAPATAIFMQLVAYRGNDVIAGSDVACYKDSNESTSASAFAKRCNYKPKFSGVSYIEINDNFTKDSGTNYWHLHNSVTFNLECYDADRFVIHITPVYKPLIGAGSKESAARKVWWTSTTPLTWNNHSALVNENTIKVSAVRAGTARTGVAFTKKTVLGGTPSPGAVLAGLCRTLGWKMIANPAERKITIMPRAQYYDGQTIDIQDRIDRNQNVTIIPNNFAQKYLGFELPQYAGTFADYYENKYSRKYGSMRVDTGYDFSADSLDMFKDTVLKSAATVQEYSPYFCSVKDKDVYKPACFLDTGNKFVLPSADDQNSQPVEFDLPGVSEHWIDRQVDMFTSDGYDEWFRLQLEKDRDGVDDGSMVLVFYGGFRRTHAHLSDDTDAGNTPTGEACWLPYMGNEGTIDIPAFTSYIAKGNSDSVEILASADMGVPKEVRLTDKSVTYEDAKTIYGRCWKKYVEDRYSADAKVCRCFVDWQGVQVNHELLRHFFWFDGCLWSLNKVNNYSANTEDPTECEFVQVIDPNNYSDVYTVPNYLTASPDPLRFPAKGGYNTLHISSNVAWSVTSWPSWLQVSGSGSGNGDGDVSFYANSNPWPGAQTGTITISGGGMSVTVTAIQEAPFIAIDPRTLVVPPKGGEYEIQVKSNVSWGVSIQDVYGAVTVDPMSGEDYQKVKVTVAENPLPQIRTFRVGFTATGVGTTYLEITQGRYYFDVQPRAVTMPQPGGEFFIDVNANNPSTDEDTEAPWKIEYDGSKIFTEEGTETQTAGQYILRKDGTAHQLITVKTNEGDPRVITLPVRCIPLADQWDLDNPNPPEGTTNPYVINVVITQAGVPRLDVTPRSLDYPADGTALQMTKTLAVSTNELFTYSGPAWLTITDITPAPGPDDPPTFDKTLQVVCATNAVPNTRVGQILFTSASGIIVTVLVTQEAAEIQTLDVIPNIVEFDAAGESKFISIYSNENWQLTGPAWITLSANSGSGNGTITLTAAAYSGNVDRYANVIVTTATGQRRNVTCIQHAMQPALRVDPVAINFGPQGGVLRGFNIYCNEGWTLTKPEWVNISAESGSGDTQITLSCLSNNTGDSRTGAIIVTSQSGLTATVTITQESYSVRHLTFKSTGGNTLSMVQDQQYGSFPNIEYSTDKAVWTAWDGTALNIADGASVYLRGMNPNGIGNAVSAEDWHFAIGGNGTVACSGNIMHLLDYSQDITTIPVPHCFSWLFKNCAKLTQAPSLPATTLTHGCYQAMFDSCTGLTAAPELPAMTLAEGCYSSMFEGCTSLSNAPSIPATTLARSCYHEMFRDCTSLAQAPSLPATVMYESCYNSMFLGCSSLTSAPALNALNLAPSCYMSMFFNTGLTSAPALPATTLAAYCYATMFAGCSGITVPPVMPNQGSMSMTEGCYSGMFIGCLNLTTAPSLGSTSLAPRCYSSMFSNCRALSAAPALPATVMAEGCYAGMFSSCRFATPPLLPSESLAKNCYANMFESSRITTAPGLPAQTLAEGCYSGMFEGCRYLNAGPDLIATALVTNCYKEMFRDSAILSLKALFLTTPNEAYLKDWFKHTLQYGSFVMSASATWDPNDYIGDSGIPTGWTVTTQ